MMYTNEEYFIVENLDPVTDDRGVVITWTARIVHPATLKMYLNSFTPDFEKRLEDYTEEDYERMKLLARYIPTYNAPFTYTGEGTPLDSMTIQDE